MSDAVQPRKIHLVPYKRAYLLKGLEDYYEGDFKSPSGEIYFGTYDYDHFHGDDDDGKYIYPGGGSHSDPSTSVGFWNETLEAYVVPPQHYDTVQKLIDDYYKMRPEADDLTPF